MGKGSTGSAVVKSVVLVFFGAVIVLGLYLMFTRSRKAPNEEKYDLTIVDEITTTNLDKNYPANPRKVVELYSKTMQVLYKEEYSDSQQSKMIDVLAGLMDEELLSNQQNFSGNIKKEVKDHRDNDYSISYFVVQSKEPEEVSVNGSKMCNVECLFTLRQGSYIDTVDYMFVMRRDEAGKWKILGWTLKEDEG